MLATAGIGLSGLVGGVAGIARLRDWLPGRPEMLLTAGVGLLLAGPSALFQTSGKGKISITTGKILAWCFLILSVLNAGDHSLWNLNLESVVADFFHAKMTGLVLDRTARGSFTPVLLAVALLLFRRKQKLAQSLFQAAVLLAIMISLLAAIGHVYDVSSFFRWNTTTNKTALSFPSALAFSLLGTALLAAWPQLPLTTLLTGNTTGGYVARRLLLAPVLIPLLTGFFQRVGRYSEFYNPEVAHWLFSFANIFVFTIVIAWISFLLHEVDLKRRAAELAVLRWNEGLEEQVHKRTDELTKANVQLQQEIEHRKNTEDQLLRAQRVECVGSLASGIAHDMNNMLAPISLVADLLAAEITSEESKRMLDLIAQSAQRGSDLVKQITVFVRGGKEGGGEADMGKLLRDLERTLRATFPTSIRVHFDIKEDLPMVVGPATELFQVLMNLTVNARDAMPIGGDLKVRASPAHDCSPPKVEIVVEDSGTGIPPENVSRIFDPFFTTKAPGKGTGLGLAMVKTIVERHGGSVSVTSAPGHGTRFVVQLAAAIQRADHPRVEDAAVFKGCGERILLVEDELALGDILRETLKNAGYSVTRCSNGVQALEQFEQSPGSFDLVLTDQQMPLMEGDVLAQKLLAVQPDVRIVLMSGSEETSRRQMRAVPSAFKISKPFTTIELLKVLRTGLTFSH